MVVKCFHWHLLTLFPLIPNTAHWLGSQVAHSEQTVTTGHRVSLLACLVSLPALSCLITCVSRVSPSPLVSHYLRVSSVPIHSVSLHFGMHMTPLHVSPVSGYVLQYWLHAPAKTSICVCLCVSWG